MLLPLLKEQEVLLWLPIIDAVLMMFVCDSLCRSPIEPRGLEL